MNNVYDEKYDIRRARYEEIPEIMDFIDKYWRKGHILSVNREFFEYEFVIKDKEVNFFIAKNKETGEIESLEGFVQASKEIENNDIWGSIWKVRNDHPNIPFLGIELSERMSETLKPRNCMGVGLNPRTALPLSRDVLNNYCAKMHHFYKLSERKEYKIAKIEDKIILKKDKNIEQLKPIEVFSIKELEKIFDFSWAEKQVPRKDKWYFEHRFFKHPIFKYRVFALNDAFFIAREQEYDNSKILRIVDFIGNQEAFSKLFDFFESLINDFEYIDFYNLGFKEEYLQKAGFSERLENSKNIIPNYFAPFVQENIEIYIAGPEDALYFKADSDQDRPN